MVRIKDKKKFIKAVFIMVVILAIVIGTIALLVLQLGKTKQVAKQPEKESENTIPAIGQPKEPEILKDWNLTLTNKYVSIEKDYIPELATIEGELKFDKRAIGYLNQMMTAIRKSGITSIWIQSSYRSYEKQEQLFNNKVTYYKNQGKNQEEAERLAQTVVQRPEQSEHNLGLAVDFNKVTNEFEDTKAFTWLQKNAAEYGFILRYPKDKEEVTGVSYESWHWRYVGKEHATIIKEKGFCLEEYIEYLRGVEQV